MVISFPTTKQIISQPILIELEEIYIVSAFNIGEFLNSTYLGAISDPCCINDPIVNQREFCKVN